MSIQPILLKGPRATAIQPKPSFGNRGIPLTDEAAGFSVIALKPLL